MLGAMMLAAGAGGGGFTAAAITAAGEPAAAAADGARLTADDGDGPGVLPAATYNWRYFCCMSSELSDIYTALPAAGIASPVSQYTIYQYTITQSSAIRLHTTGYMAWCNLVTLTVTIPSHQREIL